MLDTYIHIYALYEVTPSTKRDNEGKNIGIEEALNIRAWIG